MFCDFFVRINQCTKRKARRKAGFFFFQISSTQAKYLEFSR